VPIELKHAGIKPAATGAMDKFVGAGFYARVFRICYRVAGTDFAQRNPMEEAF